MKYFLIAVISWMLAVLLLHCTMKTAESIAARQRKQAEQIEGGLEIRP